jgi:hypothetical protein
MDDHADRWDGAHEEEPCDESETGGVIIGGFSHQVPDVDPQETTEWPDSFDVILETRDRSRARFSIGQATTDDEFTLEEAECLVGHENAQYVTVNHRFFGPLDPKGFDFLTEGPCSGRPAGTVSAHGVLNRINRSVGLPGQTARSASGSAPGPQTGPVPA